MREPRRSAKQRWLLSLCLCLTVSGGAAIAQNSPRRTWSPGAGSAFEVGTQLRPWTINDEGMDAILDVVQSMAGVNNIYMVVVMHEEHRPFQAPKFPHNPARGFFKAEDSRVSFFPDMERYGKIKPLLSDHEWIRKTDWLKLMVASCRARGLGVGAEVSHYPIPKKLVRANPDWQQKDIHGKAVAHRFCPNHPDTREYLVALFGDLASNYDLDYIQTCQYLFNGNDIDKGGTCFCRHCIQAAKQSGFDLKAAIPVLQADKNAQPEREKWLTFRRHSVTETYRLIAEQIRQENPRCHLRYNDTLAFGQRDNRDFGVFLEDMAPHLGSLVNQDHQEQLGRENEDFRWRKRWLEINRRLIGEEMPLICGIAPRMKASPELVRKGIRAALEHPANVDGLALKHYDGASFSLLRAFKQGMVENGIQGLTPTIGKEIEEMELDNYSALQEELAEDFGVATDGVGRASYVFDGSTGVYDIRITYFDEDDGKGTVRLLIAGQERASFSLDEDTDCWRWRTFKNITVKQGDKIVLVGEANRGERVVLDFLEFIRR